MPQGIEGLFNSVMLQHGKGSAEKLSDKEIGAMLANPKLTDKAKETLVGDLTTRLGDKIRSGKGTADDDRQLQLLPKFRDGTLTEGESEELGKLLGVTLPRPAANSGEHAI